MPGTGPADAAYLVLDRVRPLHQASARAVEQALAGTVLTVPLRAVLEHLLGRGPRTVPQVAREFGVTRQSVQALVDTGAARGLLRLDDNPQHRRSRLVAVTELGRRTFGEVHERELDALARVTAGLDPADLTRCAEVLALLTGRVHLLAGAPGEGPHHDHDHDPHHDPHHDLGEEPS